jgi:hypothetical protein
MTSLTQATACASSDTNTVQKCIIMEAFVMGCEGIYQLGSDGIPKIGRSYRPLGKHRKAAPAQQGRCDLPRGCPWWLSDAYGGNMDSAVKTMTQFPVVEPTFLILAMAAVTKNLCFVVTVSATYEHPLQLTRRFSMLSHLNGLSRDVFIPQVGWRRTWATIGRDYWLDRRK